MTTAALAIPRSAPTAHGLPAPVARRPHLRPRNLLTHITLLLLCAAAILPFLWMLSTSLKTLDDAMRFPPDLVPHPFAPHNYVDVLSNRRLNFLLWTRNSLAVAALVVTGTTLSSALVAYGFARLRFPGRG